MMPQPLLDVRLVRARPLLNEPRHIDDLLGIASGVPLLETLGVCTEDVMLQPMGEFVVTTIHLCARHFNLLLRAQH